MTAADHPVSPEDLMAYLDGELPLAQAAVVQAHVAGCDDCRRSSGDLRGVSRDLARWQVEIPPATMMAPWSVPAKPDERGARFRWLLKPTIAFASLILVAALSPLIYQGSSKQYMKTFINPFEPTAPAAAPYSGAKELAYSERIGDTAPQAGAGLPLPTAAIDTSVSMRSSRTGVAGGPPAPPYAPAAQQNLAPAIARTASLRLITRDFAATRAAVERIVAEMDGWFSHVSVSTSGQGRSLTAALQFPAARLDTALAALKPMGTVLEESLKGEDVTEQIVDVEARLSNARNTEKRLVDLLQRRTGALEEVLAAEREMARVREEIERFDAQRKSLDRRVTYATVNLVVMEETPATLSLGPRPVPGRFRDAFVTGLTEAVDIALGLALLVVRITPTLVVWAALLGWPVLLLVRWSRRRVTLNLTVRPTKRCRLPRADHRQYRPGMRGRRESIMSARITFVTAAGAVALGLLCGPTVSALRQDVTLNYRWTKGETIRYRIVQQSTTTISGIPGLGDMAIEQSNTQVMATVAEEVTQDRTTLRQVIESVKLEMSSPMFAMSFDSANPDSGANPMNAMLKSVVTPMIGASFTLVMAPTGEVQRVEGLSKVAEKMFQSVPQDPAMAGILDGLKANLSDEAMRSQFAQTFVQFPNRPIKSGESWTTQVSATNPMLGGLITSLTSTLKAVDGEGNNRVAKIATGLTIKQDATKPAGANPMGLTMRMGDGTGEGEQVFEAGSGRLRSSVIRSAIPMTMSGAGPDGTPVNMKTSIKATTTVELVQ